MKDTNGVEIVEAKSYKPYVTSILTLIIELTKNDGEVKQIIISTEHHELEPFLKFMAEATIKAFDEFYGMM